MKKPRNAKILIKLLSCSLALFIPALCVAAEIDSAKGRTLSLSCKGVDIVDVLRGIAIQHGVNIVPDKDVSGSVTIYLENAPFEEGLRTLLETNGFTLEKKDSIYLVHKVPAAENLRITVSDGLLTINARGADVKEVISQLSSKAKINIVAESALTGNITAYLSGVPMDDGLQAIFSANNFTLHQDAGIYSVGSRTSSKGGSFAISSRDGLLTIDVKNAPVQDVLQELAAQTKIDLVTLGNLQGKNVTVRLENVTLEEALAMISASGGIAYKKVDDIYILGDATIKPGQENPLLERKVIWLKHTEAPNILSILPSDIPKTSVTFSQAHNAIIVLGTRQTIEKVEKLIAELDVENADTRSRKESAIWVEVDEEGLISVDAKDADMEMVIRELSIRTGIDVVIIEASGALSAVSRGTARRITGATQTAPGRQPVERSRSNLPLGRLTGSVVNLRIEKATLSEVFDALFSGSPYTYKKEKSGNKEFYIIGAGNLMLGQNNPLTISKKIPLKYLDVTRIDELLPPTIPDANITVIEDQNAIAVIGTRQMIASLEEYLSQIDSPAPQVMIEAMLLELTNGSVRDLEIEWGLRKDRSVLEVTPGVSLVFDSLKRVSSAFDVSIKTLLAENKARILASPRVAVLSGETATINVGVQYLFQTTTEVYTGGYGISASEYGSKTEKTRRDVRGANPRTTPSPLGGFVRRGFNTIDTGITLDITPWVDNAGGITMKIAPQIRDADMVSAEESRIADRTIDTTIRIPDGGMIVIGGLLQEKELTKVDKIPLLGSIPLLGRLFSSSHKVTNQSELVIIITPKLIDASLIQKGDETGMERKGG